MRRRSKRFAHFRTQSLVMRRSAATRPMLRFSARARMIRARRTSRTGAVWDRTTRSSSERSATVRLIKIGLTRGIPALCLNTRTRANKAATDLRGAVLRIEWPP